MQPGTENPDSPAAHDADYEPVAASNRLGKPVRRARIGLLLFLAFLTEVIVIAAAGNQAVTNRIDRSGANPQAVKGGLESSVETFGWRFSPRTHDIFHLWAGSLALIGTTLVLSLLLILVLLRGPLTFGRAFFGTWLSVIVATMVGGYVRALVIDTPRYSREGIPARALFSELSPGSTVFLGGLALGLITALIIGLLGVATRRPAEVAAVPVPMADDADQGYADQGYAGSDDRFFGEPNRARAPAQPREVPWQDDRSTSNTTGYGRPAEQPADQRADATDTTMLPTMRGRGYGSPSADSATTDAARTDPSSTDAARTDAVTTDPRGSDTTAMTPGSDERTQRSAAADDDAHTTALPRLSREPAAQPAAETGRSEAAAAQPAAAEPDVPGPREPVTAPAATQASMPRQDAPQASMPRQDAPPTRSQHEHDEPTRQFPRPPDDEDLDPESHR